MIFTLQTIAAVLITYISIGVYQVITNIVLNSLWSVFIYGVLIYLALVADDVDQFRLEAMNYLW